MHKAPLPGKGPPHPTRVLDVLDEQPLTHIAQLTLVEAGLLVPLGDHSNLDLAMARTRQPFYLIPVPRSN